MSAGSRGWPGCWRGSTASRPAAASLLIRDGLAMLCRRRHPARVPEPGDPDRPGPCPAGPCRRGRLRARHDRRRAREHLAPERRAAGVPGRLYQAGPPPRPVLIVDGRRCPIGPGDAPGKLALSGPVSPDFPGIGRVIDVPRGGSSRGRGRPIRGWGRGGVRRPVGPPTRVARKTRGPMAASSNETPTPTPPTLEEWEALRRQVVELQRVSSLGVLAGGDLPRAEQRPDADPELRQARPAEPRPRVPPPGVREDPRGRRAGRGDHRRRPRPGPAPGRPPVGRPTWPGWPRRCSC